MIWLSYLVKVFFFCKQKTAYEMRISDWSSDVCSSDLRGVGPCPTPEPPGFRLRAGTRGSGAMRMLASAIALAIAAPASAQSLAIVHAEAWTMEGDTPVHDATILVAGSRILSVKVEIGRGSCRGRGVKEV